MLSILHFAKVQCLVLNSPMFISMFSQISVLTLQLIHDSSKDGQKLLRNFNVTLVFAFSRTPFPAVRPINLAL